VNDRDIPVPVTAIILTLDEERNIRQCLECLRWAEDVAIVDSRSSDGTLRISREARPDVRIFTHPFKDFGDQRNWALDNTSPRHEWILFVDADEFCADDIADEIKAFIDRPGDAVGAFVAGRNYFLGRWLKHCTMFPSYQLRLLKLGHVRYQKEGHGQREVCQGKLIYFRNGWRHEAVSKGLHQWIARHNDYSTEELSLVHRLRQEPLRLREILSQDPIIRRRAAKRLSVRVPARPAWDFAYRYFIRLGFLDGYPGLIYCLLRLAHYIHIEAKLAEEHYLNSRRSA
jgi:glycosyltransferase involved in cell wall biosynthesis